VAFKNWLKWWELLTQSSRCTRRRRRGNARTRERLNVELLEDRTVPSLVYTPALGPETELHDNGAREGNNPVYFVFNGNDWGGGLAGVPSPKDIYAKAASDVLATPYLSGLTKSPYNTSGKVSYANAIIDTNALNNGFSGGDLDTLLRNDFGNGSLPDPEGLDPSPIYVVVTEAGIRSDQGGNVAGFNTRTTVFNLFHPDGANEIWVNGDSVDSFTDTLSHELAETLTDVGAGGFAVNPGAAWTGTTENSGQIGDYEGSAYAYRDAQGYLVQPYWSVADQAWLGPDGLFTDNTQKFVIQPHWNNGTYTNHYDLVINGDQWSANQSDNLLIGTTDDGVTLVILNGEVQLFDLGGMFKDSNGKFVYQRGTIDDISINLGGGSDTIDIESTTAGIVGITNDSGSDAVNLGNGSLAQVGRLVDIGGAGVTSLTVDDSLDTADQTVAMDDQSVTFLNNSTHADTIVFYDGVNYLNVKTGWGNNNVNVYGTTPLGWTDLYTRDGKDTITISGTSQTLDVHSGKGHNTIQVARTSQALYLDEQGNDTVTLGNGNLWGIAGPVHITNPAASTSLTLDDHLDYTTPRTISMGATSFSGGGLPTIDWSGVNYLDVEAGTAGNIINVADTIHGGSTDLFSGTGSDTVTVTATSEHLDVFAGAGSSNEVDVAPGAMNLASIQGPLLIDGSGGHTSVFLHDELKPQHDAYTITATSTTAKDPATITYDGVAAITLYGAASATYDVQSTPAGATYTLDAGVGPNTLSIAPGLRGLILNGFTAAPLTIDDSADTGNVTYTITPTTVQVSGSPAITYTGAPSLTVLGGSGADTFNVQGTSAFVPVTLVTGPGTNVVNVSPRDKELLDILSDLTIQGHGQTTAVLDNQNETGFALLGLPDIYTVTASTVTDLDTSATIHYSGLSGLTLNGDPANDVYNVESTAAGTSVTLNTGLGTNTVIVAPTSQDMSQILGDLTIHGRGQTSAVLEDQNDIIPILEFVPSFYYVTDSAVQFDFFGEGTIYYSGLSGLTLNADRLTDDFFDIESTAAGTTVTLNTGPNSNEVDVTPINKRLANLRAGLVIQPSSAGQTSVSLDDSADTANAAYTITATTVQASGAAAVTYAGATSLTLKGGSGTDNFKVQGTAATTPVTLNTGAGSNTVTVAGQSKSMDAIPGPLRVNAGAGPAALVVDDQATTGARTWTLAQGNLKASAAGTNGTGAYIAFSKLASVTVNGGSGGNTFNVQGTDAGTSFTLNTGAGNDTVNVGDTRNTFEEFLGTLTVSGQAGSDALNLNDQGELDPATQGNHFGYHTENDTWSPAANGLPARVDFSHIPAGVLAQPGTPGQFVTTSLYWQNFQQIVFTDPVGGSTSVHAFLPNALAGTHLTLHGGVLNEILESGAAAGQQQTFTVTGQYAGTVGNISFTGESSLLSFGAGQAKFKFLPGGSEAGLNGDGFPAVLDLSALTTPATVNLPYFSTNGYNWGSVPGVIQVFASMTSVIGAAGDTLVGGNAANAWSVTGKNAGQVSGVAFSGFSNLTGGSQADTFAFVNGGSVTGAVNGGGGVNALDYSGLTGNVIADLPLGVATLVGGGVQNIQNVAGGGGTSILVGNGTGNTLTGGTGRNLLIAGGGPGTLLGGPDEDILVGGKTAYDGTISALNALMAEWSRTDLPYGARVAHLLFGGGLNGATVLNVANFTANAGGNTLTGAGGLDLFYGSPTRDANDWTPSIGEVFVGQDGIHVSTQITVGGLSVSAVLDGTVTLATNSSQRLTLTLGNHTITDPRSGAAVSFSVSVTGTVSYAAGLEGVLSGAGTSTLTVNGRTITIDATALSMPRLVLDSALLVLNSAPSVFTDLPGTYQLTVGGTAPPTVSFTLNPNGTVAYAPALEGILTGAGTSTLKVNGRTVTIDATALSLPAGAVDNAVLVRNTAPLAFTGLPGQYIFTDPSGGTPAVTFTINPNGTVGYDATLEGILTGAGTSTLKVNGRTVTLDATALTLPAGAVDNAVLVRNTAPLAFTGLPGQYIFTDPSGGTPAVTFTINPNGTVSYDPTLEGILTGAGTSTLKVHGVTVTLDATALTLPAGALDNAVLVRNTAPLVFTGLPGSYQFTDPSGGSPAVSFTINLNGTVGYDPTLEGILTGAGTSTLKVHGVTVTIDARAVPPGAGRGPRPEREDRPALQLHGPARRRLPVRHRRRRHRPLQPRRRRHRHLRPGA
jgi:hypothetical protein